MGVRIQYVSITRPAAFIHANDKLRTPYRRCLNLLVFGDLHYASYGHPKLENTLALEYSTEVLHGFGTIVFEMSSSFAYKITYKFLKSNNLSCSNDPCIVPEATVSTHSCVDRLDDVVRCVDEVLRRYQSEDGIQLEE